MAFIIAVRPIDLAIFGTLGLLWIGGALFIVALYRWIRRFEAESGSTTQGLEPRASTPRASKPSASVSVAPEQAVAREALAVRS